MNDAQVISDVGRADFDLWNLEIWWYAGVGKPSKLKSSFCP